MSDTPTPAEIARLLREAADEIAGYVKREYAGSAGYPSMERRMARDMEIVKKLRDAELGVRRRAELERMEARDGE